MRYFLGTALALAGTVGFMTGAVAQPAPQTAPPAGRTAAAPVTAQEFASTAAMSDKFEIEASNLAIQRSKRQEVTAFARQMVTDHTKSTEKLKDATGKDKLTQQLPDKLDAKHADMLERLRRAPDNTFDRTFVEMQVNGHREAVDLFRNFSRNGNQGAVKQFAADTLPAIEGHLQHIEGIQKSNVVGAR